MSAQRFRSRIDALFYIVFAVGVGLPFTFGVLALREGHWWPLAAAAALAAFMAIFAASTYYVVDDRSLHVRCLLVRKTIPLVSITGIRPTNNPLSAPALSLDRLEITYSGAGWPGFTLVSPADKAGFIDAIRRAQPAATVGPSTAQRSNAVWLAIVGVIGPIVIVAALMYANSLPPNVVVTPSELTVSGAFGVIVPMHDIASVTLEDAMPRVVRKRMGADSFTALRGRFELEGIGEGRLYVQRSARPYVLIRTRDSFVYINYSERERTQTLFDDLKRARASASTTNTSTIVR